MPKVEKKFILSKQPLALHLVERTGWKRQCIESYVAFDIQDALKIILKHTLISDPASLAKMERLDDKEFTKSAHRKRRYIAKHLEIVYLQKDEAFAKKNSIELYGYWFPTNIGFKELSSIFLLACEAVGVEGSLKHSLKSLGEL